MNFGLYCLKIEDFRLGTYQIEWIYISSLAEFNNCNWFFLGKATAPSTILKWCRNIGYLIESHKMPAGPTNSEAQTALAQKPVLSPGAKWSTFELSIVQNSALEEHKNQTAINMMFQKCRTNFIDHQYYLTKCTYIHHMHLPFQG